VIYLDEFAVGGENSSYADVAPGTVLKADFTYETNDCDSSVSFTNEMSSKLGAVDSCVWSFGDGTESREISPSHVYSLPGTYQVSLTAYDSIFSDVEKDSVTLYFASSPEDVSEKKNDDGSVTLTATGNGTIYWYDTIAGGETLGTGSPFITPVTDKEVFYAENIIGGKITVTGGKKEKGATGDFYKWVDYAAVWGLKFNTETDMILKSVKVYNGESENGSYTGERTFTVVTASGDTVSSATVEVKQGEQSLELDLPVPAGDEYRLLTDRHVGLWRDTEGASYPYSINPTVTITGGVRYDGLQPPDRIGYYYFFYDWEIEADIPLCVSRRVDTDSPTSMRSFFNNRITLYPNPANGYLFIDHLPLTGNDCLISLYNNKYQQVRNIRSNGRLKVEIGIKDLAPGIYLCKIVSAHKILCIKKVVIMR
jgi:PKD repeat protein